MREHRWKRGVFEKVVNLDIYPFENYHLWRSSRREEIFDL